MVIIVLVQIGMLMAAAVWESEAQLVDFAERDGSKRNPAELKPFSFIMGEPRPERYSLACKNCSRPGK